MSCFNPEAVNGAGSGNASPVELRLDTGCSGSLVSGAAIYPVLRCRPALSEATRNRRYSAAAEKCDRLSYFAKRGQQVGENKAYWQLLNQCTTINEPNRDEAGKVQKRAKNTQHMD
jgi:hypothetical protein